MPFFEGEAVLIAESLRYAGPGCPWQGKQELPLVRTMADLCCLTLIWNG